MPLNKNKFIIFVASILSLRNQHVYSRYVVCLSSCTFRGICSFCRVVKGERDMPQQELGLWYIASNVVNVRDCKEGL